MTVEYNRAFTIQSCHFNDERTYDAHDKAMAAAVTGDYFNGFTGLCDVLRDSHGHNFEISISARANELLTSECERGGQSWVVDDEVLRDMVAMWDNTNLSVHKDFEGVRATTENMARILRRKLREAFPDVQFAVRVRENFDVEASEG